MESPHRLWALHKKSSQTLSVSPESPFDWNFLKVGSVIFYSFLKKPPQLTRPALASPKSESLGQQYDLVCTYQFRHWHQYSQVANYIFRF